MIRDYLLRRLPEADRGRFEEAYFNDDQLFERVEAAEDQLVSEYVLGKLEESDRKRFEASLLNAPYYRDRVETTSRLNRRVLAQAALRRPARPLDGATLFPGRTGVSVAFSLMAILLVASLVSAWRLKVELAAARREPAPAPEVRVVVPRQLLLRSPGAWQVEIVDRGGRVVSRAELSETGDGGAAVRLPAGSGASVPLEIRLREPVAAKKP